MTLLIRLFLGVFLLSFSLRAADNVQGEKDISEKDKTSFNQKVAQANMLELEGRMFQLAELIREAEPENATRLLLALKQSRKDLIIEEMAQIQDMLAKDAIGKALEKQKTVLRKLKELRDLLVNMDLDFKLKLDRLKKLKQALDHLNEVIEEQGRQIGQSGDLAEGKGKPSEEEAKEAADKAKKEQEATREETDKVKEKVEEAGGADGAMAIPNLDRAKGNMSGAEGQLGEGKPGGAQSEQKKAKEDLNKAKKALEKAMEELQLDLDNRLRAQVMQALIEMLQRQRIVTQQTIQLGPKATKGDANALFGVKRLAKKEVEISDICTDTLSMLEDTEWSYAIPPILESLNRRILYVATDLKAGRADQAVVDVEKSIEKDLELLLETMDEIPPSDPGEQRSNPAKAQEQDMNKMLAELRILRMLQIRVNEETIDVDGQRRRAEAEMTARLKKKIGTVKENQYDVYKATAKLHYKMVDPDMYFQ